MKRFSLITLVGLFILFTFSALAQTPAPTPTGVAVTAASATPASLIAWIEANWGAVIAPLVVAILDLIFALNPNSASNGILHWIFTAVGGKTP